MGIGSVLAIRKVTEMPSIHINDVNVFEINEAFVH